MAVPRTVPTNHDDQRSTMTTREVATYLGHADVSTVLRLVAAGRLRPVHKAPGGRGRYTFDSADIIRFRTERNG